MSARLIAASPAVMSAFALAAIAHARLHEVTQMLEGFGKTPILQRRRLVERVRLRLDQRQVMP